MEHYEAFKACFPELALSEAAFARMAQEAGAQAVCVHGRTRAQMYAGKADWDALA